MLPEDIPEKERDDEEGKADARGGDVSVPKDSPWQDQAVVVESLGVSNIQHSVKDCGFHLLLLCPALLHSVGSQHGHGGQEQGGGGV